MLPDPGHPISCLLPSVTPHKQGDSPITSTAFVSKCVAPFVLLPHDWVSSPDVQKSFLESLFSQQ